MGYFSHPTTVIKGYASNWSAQSDYYYYFYYTIYNGNTPVISFPANGNPYNVRDYDYNVIANKLYYMGGGTAISGNDSSLFENLMVNTSYTVVIYFGNIDPQYDAYDNFIGYQWSWQPNMGMEYAVYNILLKSYVSFVSPLTSSGSISMSSFTQAFPFISPVDLNNSYVRSSLGKKGSGTTISLSNGYSKYPVNILDQNIYISDVLALYSGGNGFGGCAGVGYKNVYVNITKASGINIYMPYVYNDYVGYPYQGGVWGKSTTPSYNPWVYIGAYSDLNLNSSGNFAINNSTSYTFSTLARPIAGGRDWTALRVTATVDIVTWMTSGQCPVTITVARDCKGGGYGFTENAISNATLSLNL